MTRVVGIASGKGGAGKTSVTVGLAFALARAGRRVCILDADLGLANVDILLGLSPTLTLEDALFGRAPLARVMLPVAPGVNVIPGSSGVARMADLSRADRMRLAREFHTLRDHDFLLVDTSPGISRQVTSLCLACEELAVVVNPEATSITDGYALIKVLKEQGLARPPMLVVNRSRDEALARAVFGRVKAAAQKYLSLNLAFLGQIPWDETLSLAAARQRPLLDISPACPASLAFLGMARTLSGMAARPQAPHRFFDAAVVRALERPTPEVAPPAGAPDRAGLVRELTAAISLLDGVEDVADPVARAGRLATARLGLRRLRDKMAGEDGAERRTTPPRARAVVVSPDRSMAEVLTEAVEAAGLLPSPPRTAGSAAPRGRALGLVYFDGAPGELDQTLAGVDSGPVVLVTPRGHLAGRPMAPGVAEVVEAPFRMETLFTAIRRHAPVPGSPEAAPEAGPSRATPRPGPPGTPQKP